jgi:DNA-binding Lrp family transcriptional regulator
MKKLEEPLIKELKAGGCVPAITTLAKRLKQPGSTIHFNVKKMEKEGKILSYNAVFDHSKIGEGFTVFALVKLSDATYKEGDFTEKVAKKIATHPEVESVDIMTGDWELLVKIRAKDQGEYYSLARKCIAMPGVVKVHSMVSLRQFKSEYVVLP